MSTQQKNTFSSGMIPIRVTNTTGETIPPNSCVAIGASASMEPGAMKREGTGAGKGRFTVDVRKPDSEAVDTDSRAAFLFTLDFAINPGKTGYATMSMPAFVAVNESVTTRGQGIGPIPGSWALGLRDGFYAVVDLIVDGSRRYAMADIDDCDIRAGVTVGWDPVNKIECGEACYPERPANTFWVKLGRPVYAKSDGLQALFVIPYSPPQYRLCHEYRNNYVEHGTNVWITRQHGQYFFIPTTDVIFGFKLVEDMSEGESLAEIYRLDGASFGGQVGEDPLPIYDPSGWADELLKDGKGLCNFQGGKYYAIQAPCPEE